jgi:hypothetical protein
MVRAARLTVTDKASWYFLYAKTNATIKKGTLTEPECGDKLLSIIAAYSEAFECELAGVFISKYHYVLVVKFHKFKIITPKVLLKKATALYEGKQERFDLWTKQKWSEFNTRLFDVGEYMRAIQMSFARWFNKKLDIKGKHFWAERFKSVILTNDTVALDALLYAETGPVREKDCADISSYKYSSLYLRNKGAEWLAPLSGLIKDKAQYQQMLHHRANLPVKTGAVISKEIKNGYLKGCYLKRQPSFLDGLVLGSESEVQVWINTFIKKGLYLRRKKPNKIAIGTHYSMREQRRHAAKYR